MSDSEKTKTTWAPNPSIEARRLQSKKDSTPWNIAGSSPVKQCTRGRRVALVRPPTPDNNEDVLCSPCGNRKRSLFLSPDDCSAVSSLTGGDASGGSGALETSTRFIGETAAMVKMMEEFMICPRCNEKVSVTMTSKGSGIATFTRIECADITCTFVHVDSPLPANVPLLENAGSENIKRNTDYAVNVLYVLGLMASGDGGTEATRLLGLLGLPNATTMQARTFGNVEKQIGPVMQTIANEVILEDLKQEVKEFYGEKTMPGDDDNRKLYDVWLAKELPADDFELWPKITASADMGWQQKGSGRRYEPGIGMNGGYTEEDLDAETTKTGRRKRGKKKKELTHPFASGARRQAIQDAVQKIATSTFLHQRKSRGQE